MLACLNLTSLLKLDMLACQCACHCAGSICAMKRNTHIIVPGSHFKLVSGQDNLSCYQVLQALRSMSLLCLPVQWQYSTCDKGDFCRCSTHTVTQTDCHTDELSGTDCWVIHRGHSGNMRLAIFWTFKFAVSCTRFVAVWHQDCTAPVLQDLWRLQLLHPPLKP